MGSKALGTGVLGNSRADVVSNKVTASGEALCFLFPFFKIFEWDLAQPALLITVPDHGVVGVFTRSSGCSPSRWYGSIVQKP